MGVSLTWHIWSTFVTFNWSENLHGERLTWLTCIGRLMLHCLRPSTSLNTRSCFKYDKELFIWLTVKHVFSLCCILIDICWCWCMFENYNTLRESGQRLSRCLHGGSQSHTMLFVQMKGLLRLTRIVSNDCFFYP